MELLAGEQYDVVTMVWLGRRYGKGVRAAINSTALLVSWRFVPGTW